MGLSNEPKNARGTLIAVLGPTAVGKTSVSVELAMRLGTHVVSADSRQMFQRMDIGTAKPTLEERKGVPHHFIDNLRIGDYYSAARYQDEALKLLGSLFQKNDQVLLTGGSMMYTDALLNGLDEIPTVDPQVRRDVKDIYDKEGLEGLRLRLRQLDPEYYLKVDLMNHQRLIHAIEVCLTSGQTFTSLRTRQRKERPFSIIKIGLMRPREELFSRINARVDVMIRQGLLKEAESLYDLRSDNALNTVGYKELFAYMEDRCSLEEAVEKIKRNTRVYAKKQMTWYKRDHQIQWFHPDDLDGIIYFIQRDGNGISAACPE